MKYIGILLGLLLWPAACMAPPTYGPYPTGGGGLSSNEVYNIALSVGGPTNGISAATATNIVNNNNAATATWATNLVFPGGYSEILVADAALTTKAVSYDDFKFFSGSGESRMELGTVGSTGSGGRIRIHDVLDQQDVDIRVTNSTIFFPNGITLQDAVQSYSLVNGVKLPLFKGENHNSVENVGYFTGNTWDAVAFQVGHSGRAQATNGQRFSFLIGETDHSWNLIQFTNTTISRWTAGTSGPQQKNVVSYNSSNETYEFGTNVRSAILSGTNLTLTGKTNISFAGSDGVMRLNTDGLSVGDTGKGGKLRLWDDIQSQWISAYAEDDVVIFDKAFAAPSGTFTTHLTVSQTNVLGLNGSLINAVGITNGNVSIPGTLGVTGATTMGALYGTTISGNGGGITNVPASAITGTYADITTTNLSALSGMLRLVTGSGTGTTNTWRLFSDGDAISMDFLETSAGSPSGYIFDRVFNSDGNFTWAGSIIATNAIVTLDEFHGDGGGISNLNAAYISGDLSVSNLTATTLIADSFVGNGAGLTNVGGVVNVRDFGAVGNGTTDDTMAFQTAVNTLKPVLVPGGFTYLIGNVNLSNFSQVIGYGGSAPTLKFLPSATGSMLRGITSTNILISNLILDGTNSQDYAGVAVAGTRGAVNIANGSLENLTASGFDNWTLAITNTTLTGQNRYRGDYVRNCSVDNSWGGFYLDDQYYTTTDLHVSHARNAIYTGKGNNNFIGCRISLCNRGLWLTEGSNGGHGNWVGGSINHNTVGVYILNVTVGFNFTGSQFWNTTGTNLLVVNSTGVRLSENQIGAGYLSFGGGNTSGTNYVWDNWFQVAPTIVTNFGGSNCPVRFQGNVQDSGVFAHNETSGGTFTGGTLTSGLGAVGLTNTISGIGTTIAPFFYNTNSTLAAAGAQQVSPALMLYGNGWKTDAPASSVPVGFGLYTLPTQGAAAPSGSMHFVKSVNNATPTTIGNITEFGNLTISGGFVSGSYNYAGATSKLGFNGGDGLYNPNVGHLHFTDTGVTKFNVMTFGPGAFTGNNSLATNYPALRIESTTNTVTFGVRRGTDTNSFGYFAAQYYMPSNSLATWPTTPARPGDAFWGNSNGTIYLLQSGMGNTWIATNKIGL